MRQLTKLYTNYTALICICLLSSCSSEPGENSNRGIPDFPVKEISPNGDEAYLTGESSYIFDQNLLHSFYLEIPNNNWTKLNNDPAAEEYVEGTFIFEGDTISPVGIRYKGSIGAFAGCVSGEDWTRPSGYKTCTKLSMKIKINWQGREDHFYGLKKVQLHAMNQDPSQMRERLGYALFNEMGVSAPRCTHAKLYVNGDYVGVFALVEQIDGRFSRHHFENGKGNIYKEIWPVDDKGHAYNRNYYIHGLKTNEDEANVDLIRSFGVDLALAPVEDWKGILEKYMDIRESLAYWVVDRSIRHDDGPAHYYCQNQQCSNHNYYWYEDPVRKKFHLVPWDLDNAFENIIFNANPVTPVADGWGEISNQCQPFRHGSFNIFQKSAACDRIIGTLATYDDQYAALKQEFLDGPFSEERTNQFLDTWSAQIREASLEAEALYEDAVSISRWESSIQTLKSQLQHARTH